jgi:hypothetical protein
MDVMDLQSIRRQLDEQRRTLFPEGIVGEVLPEVTRIRGEAGDWHEIAFSSLTGAAVEAVIAQQVEHYRALNAELEWKVYSHDFPPDLRHRLERQGFEIGERETVVVLDLSDRPGWIDAPPAHRVVNVSTPEALETFRAVAESVSGSGQEPILSELASAIRRGSSQHRGYIVYDSEVPAGVGRLYTHPESAFAGLYGGCTLEEHRRRGLYRASVAARARDAVALGARYLTVDALPTSQPTLERLGFVRLSETWPCRLSPAHNPA